MDEKEQRIKIAEACGWDCDPEETREWDSRGQWCVAPAGYHFKWPYSDLVSKAMHLPDYLNDLNAIQEAVMSLSIPQRSDWSVELNKTMGMESSLCGWQDLITATAAQRCEAYLKVKGLWDEL